MSLEPFTFLGYVDGANHGSWSITSTAWVIFTPSSQVLSSGGSFLGLVTNNVAEYSTSIELIVKANTLVIQQIIIKLDSQLVVYQLNGHYQVRDPILFRNILRVCLLERHFEFIEYIHVPGSSNSLVDSLANYVLDWHLCHTSF